MTEQDDHKLLTHYVREGSESAFGELVRRYLNLVYSTARRLTSNPDHAQDITQAVFIILARKAASLRQGTIVSGWLYQTTRLTARNFVRGEIRRERREHEAFMQSTLTQPESAQWEQITPVLDKAMGRLGRLDRDAIVLRFFQNKTSAEVGRALNVSEAAAHKRVSRAVEKLRTLFMKRGVTLSSAAIAGTIGANSVHAAPAAVASAVASAGVGKAAVAGSVQWAVDQTLRHLLWLKMKAAVLAVVILALAGGGVIVAERQKTKRTRSASAHVVMRVPQNKAPALQYPIGPALITIKLLGTPGLHWKVSWSGTGGAQTTNGVLPAELAFSADGYTATIDVQGSGDFGYEIHRGSMRQAARQVSPITKPRSITITAKPGGTGISSRENPVGPNP